MRSVQVLPRYTFKKPCACLFTYQKLTKLPTNRISTQTIRPLFTFINVLFRSFTSEAQTKPKKPANVNTNPLDVNSNLNILQGLILAGEYPSVDTRIQKILQKNTPDKIKIELWNLMLSFYASQRNVTKLGSVLKAFEESKVQPNTGTFILLLQYWGSTGKIEEIEKLVSQAESATYILDLPLIFHTAIASSSNFNKMYEFVERMKNKKLVANSDTLMAFITSAIRQNNLSQMELAIKRFRERGIEPHADAYAAILSAHHEKGNKSRVNQYLYEIKKKQLDQNLQLMKLMQNLNLQFPEQTPTELINSADLRKF